MTIYVINPNSSTVMTDGIRAAVTPLVPPGVQLRCLTLPEGPPGIETDAQVAAAAGHVVARAACLTDASAIISACFSDPGVAELRRSATIPIIGIREAAVQRALQTGNRFGVIAIGAASVPRHLAAFAEMGISDRLAGDRPLNLGVTDLADPARCQARMIEVARQLYEDDGADVLILGCAGMPQYASLVTQSTGLHVVEPCQAAVALALEHLTVEPTPNPEHRHA